MEDLEYHGKETNRTSPTIKCSENSVDGPTESKREDGRYQASDENTKQNDSLPHICTKQDPTPSANNLDRYLENIFTTHCRFTISEEEVCFIEQGVVTIVNQVLHDAFETQANSSHCGKFLVSYEMLKIGSFYEGTKNNFPDSFDFIVVLGNTESKPDASAFPKESFFKGVMDTGAEKYKVTGLVHFVSETDRSLGNREDPRIQMPATLSLLDFKENGHAQILQIYYSNLPNCEHILNVTIIFAFKANNIEKNIRYNQVTPNEFYEEIVKTGHLLYVSGSNGVETESAISAVVAESELSFVREVLSDSHVKVLRILKYLINGNMFCFDQSRSIRNSVGFNITSRHIKNSVIHHHYTKSCNSCQGIGFCVLGILRALDKLLALLDQCTDDNDDDKTLESIVHLLPDEEERFTIISEPRSPDDICRKRYVKAFTEFVKRLEHMHVSVDTFDTEFETEACVIVPFRVSLIQQRRTEEREKRRCMTSL